MDRPAPLPPDVYTLIRESLVKRVDSRCPGGSGFRPHQRVPDADPRRTPAHFQSLNQRVLIYGMDTYIVLQDRCNQAVSYPVPGELIPRGQSKIDFNQTDGGCRQPGSRPQHWHPETPTRSLFRPGSPLLCYLIQPGGPFLCHCNHRSLLYRRPGEAHRVPPPRQDRCTP